MTLYLKYRPKTIDELDLTEVREQLRKIVASGRIPHAFLFAGPRGAGKTSAARILAKIVNCEAIKAESKKQKAEIEPCNKCSQCTAIVKGASLDIIEIDAASHRGVDDVRSLREAVKLSPAGAKMKVYIIDEAHMLTTEASNALLKTLEEPPEHVMFILATTTPEKLLDTIRSRCTTLTFRKARPEEVVRSLERVVKGEKLKVQDGALQEIAGNVDGSFREAHKILEQLSLEGGRITRELARKLVALNSADVTKLLLLLGKKDTKGALKEIDKVAQSGANLKAYTTEVIGTLRRMLLARMGVEGEDIKDIKGIKDIGEIKRLIELFSEAARQLPTAVIAQLPLEMAVVRFCEQSSERWEVSSELGSEKKEVGKDTHISHHTSKPTSHNPLPTSNLREQWREIMKKVKPKNHSIEALLRATRVADFDGKTLKVEVFYEFHKERLEREQYRKIVEEVASEVLGGPVKMVCVLSAQKQRAVDIANIDEEIEEDILKAAEEIFGGNGKDVN